MINVVICDAHFISRTGLCSFLAKQKQLKVVGSVSNQGELETFIGHTNVDLFIIDYDKDEAFGLGSLGFIREHCPSSLIIVCSDDMDKQRIYEAIEHGINAFVPKSAEESELHMAIEKSLKAEKYFVGHVLQLIINRSFSTSDSSTKAKPQLTQREIEIVKLIASGKVAKDISTELHLSVHTIYTHRKNIMKKLGFSSPVELIMYAMNEGLFSE